MFKKNDNSHEKFVSFSLACIIGITLAGIRDHSLQFLLMYYLSKITLHHLFFGHFVNSFLDLGIFLRELCSLRKIRWSKTITPDFTH